MSPDEAFPFIFSIIFSLVAWGRWIYTARALAGVDLAPGARTRWRGVVPAACTLSLAGLFCVLAFWASYDVRDSLVYMIFYLLIGAAVVPMGIGLLGWLGLSLRDDVIERRNPAARLALAGAVVGFSAAYAGSNIGDGPGWWVVLVCSGLAFGSLLAAWCVLAKICRVAERITVERDEAAGLRTGAWFVASGVILGRAAAGNWLGMAGAWNDFWHIAWGSWSLLVVALLLEAVLGGSGGAATGGGRLRMASVEAARMARPSLFARGVVPALIQFGLAWLFLAFFGRW